MTPNDARTLSLAVTQLGARNDQDALIAARCIANMLKAEDVVPASFAAMLATTLQTIRRPVADRGFGELGPRAARARMAVLARRRGMTPEDRERIGKLRERLFLSRRMDLPAGDVEWLNGLWEQAQASANG